MGLRTFVFFAAFAALSIAFNYFVVVETTGVSLEDMDKQFNDNTNHEDNARMRDILYSMVSGKQTRRTHADTAFGQAKTKPQIQHFENAAEKPTFGDAAE